jgi:hypothetical protein
MWDVTPVSQRSYTGGWGIFSRWAICYGLIGVDARKFIYFNHLPQLSAQVMWHGRQNLVLRRSYFSRRFSDSYRQGLGFCGVIRISLLTAALWTASAIPAALAEGEAPKAATKSEALFLDRLMMAESGGKLDAKNLRSSALGPFQFIRSTFYEVVMRHLPELADGKSYAEIQQLRVDREVARQAALAYTRENAVKLDEGGVKPEPGFLRLAFLLGPRGAISVISAKPETPVSSVLSTAAIEANPFMQSMTAEQLIERAKREAAGLKPLPIFASAKTAAAHPKIKVRCNLKRASCRKWLALAKKRLARKTKTASR